jgi:SAM-dependent methyltransferase
VPASHKRHDATTWHHGLVARWWAEFNEADGDDAYFLGVIERTGTPVLDAGCGTGRVLLPLLRTGIDIDGSDASADMLDWCRKSAESEGHTVHLYAQPMYALQLPRQYRTIMVCGAFGLGGTRADDLEGLRRIHAHLEPGGTLVMDHYLPNFDARAWSTWIEAPDLPRRWPSRGDRRRASDGTELELRSRVKAFDPLEQTTTLEIRASQFLEIELMLTTAGFREIRVTGNLEDRAPLPWADERIVFEALA